MKKIITIALGTLIFTSCTNSKKNAPFELKGILTDSKGETLILEKLVSPQPIVVDSAIINDKGEFEFVNYKPHIGFYRIKLSQSNFAMLVLDSMDKVSITGSVKDLGNTYKVTGSEETKIFLEYNEFSKKRDKKLDSLNQVFYALAEGKQYTEMQRDSLSKTFEEPYTQIMAGFNEELSKKILTHKDKYSSIMAIQGMEPDKFADLYKALDEGLQKKYADDKNVKMFHEIVTKMLASALGQSAAEISLPNPDGKIISLSQFKGKYVLIDFWASWCGPCRKEMPNVVAAYAKFKDKGFEIFGVSLDQSKDKWIEAIAKDGITWPQVSDLKFWDSEPAKQYGVQSIPYTVLIDKEGKIIAKNLRGDELEKKLAEILK
ncbi:MAG: AhpC/TSA family protein [Bacteroidetes bacterium]|nr:AhpC/TSA family protein [Bacteroidota bacterium]